MASSARSIAEAGEVLVEFDGREIAYGFGELDELVLAYATTIHKSQGSEYPAVVIPLTTQHYPMLRRNLVYTGVTRGRRLVVIVGQRRAVRNRGSGRAIAPTLVEAQGVAPLVGPTSYVMTGGVGRAEAEALRPARLTTSART